MDMGKTVSRVMNREKRDIPTCHAARQVEKGTAQRQ